MMTLLPQYAGIIPSLPLPITRVDPTAGGKLRIAGDCQLTICYAPLDYLNPHARIVIVGITPGLQQMNNALITAFKQLRLGASLEDVSRNAKEAASFSGPMRRNLVDMLDHFGIAGFLQIRSCLDLFAARSDLVHYTSILRYPVFRNRADYAGSPDPMRHPLLRKHLEQFFGEEVRILRDAIYVPLGPTVERVLREIAKQGLIDARRVLFGLLHPSPNNRERIDYMLGRKRRDRVSKQVRTDRIDLAAESLRTQVAAIAALI